jgi:uncharacterized membrane protein HdeD (DUF308 family)
VPVKREPCQSDAFPWYLGLARAVPAIVLAMVITFSADHSPLLGLIVFGAFALVSGLWTAVVAISRMRPGTLRLVVLCHATVAVLTGVAALAVPGGGYGYFVLLLSAYLAICGFLELYLALRAGAQSPARRDWVFTGGMSVALSITALVIPATFFQPFSVEGVEGAVTASVALVGLFGAYLAVIGIYLTIAAFSLKWLRDQAPAARALSDSNALGV